MTVEPDTAQEFMGGGTGRFFSPKRELKAGDAIVVKLLDVSENKNTKYPIKEKDFCYRVAFTDPTGEARIWDISGKDTIRQIFRCLYPNGLDKGVVACKATIRKRLERTTKQGDLEITPIT